MIWGIWVLALSLKTTKLKPGVVVYAFNPSTREAGAGRFLSSRQAWSTKCVLGQPGLHRETLSQNKKEKPKPKKLLIEHELTTY
jgi:hypothetical protein